MKPIYLERRTGAEICRVAAKTNEPIYAYELLYSGLRKHFGGVGADPNGEHALEYIRNAKVDVKARTVNGEQVEP